MSTKNCKSLPAGAPGSESGSAYRNRNTQQSPVMTRIDAVVSAPVAPVVPVSAPLISNCDCGPNPPANHYTDCPRFVAPPGWTPLPGVKK
jgi:hypothetical protein